MATATTHTFDATRKMQDAGLVASSEAGTVIEDLGPGIGHRVGKIVCDITALEIASNDEVYDIIVQGSPDAAFGTAGNIVELATLNLSAKEVKRSDSDRDDATGRREIFFNNLKEDGVPLRYLRLYIAISGAISTGINFTARYVPLDIRS